MQEDLLSGHLLAFLGLRITEHSDRPSILSYSRLAGFFLCSRALAVIQKSSLSKGPLIITLRFKCGLIAE